MGGKPVDHTGRSFGLWTALEISGSAAKGGAMWLCRCACGVERSVPAESLVRGKSKSCGCASNEMRRVGSTIHGHTRMDGYMSGTYRSWHAMRQRCENQNVKQYGDYGGRGIRVCAEWSDFARFLKDMGERPEGMTLDRFPNVNGNYEPTNCRWATKGQQTANRRTMVKHRFVLPLLTAAQALVAANDNDVLPLVAALRVAVADYQKQVA